MSAIVSGAPMSANTTLFASSFTSSNFHDLCFFRLQKFVDLRDEIVVHLLQIALGVLDVILTGVLELLQPLAAFRPCMANSDSRFFRELVNDFHQLTAPLL